MTYAAMDAPASEVATPPSSAGGLSGLSRDQAPLDFFARAGARFASFWGGPVRIAGKVVVGRHADVREVLSRDLEFRIAPVNATRIAEVNGAFVLGMDRDVTLLNERALLYRALSEVDMAPLRAAIADMAETRIAAAGSSIDVVEGYARPIAAATATSLFGIHSDNPALFMDVARAVFNHIFLNLGGDEQVKARALRAAEHMRRWFADEIAKRRQSGALGADMMGALLKSTSDDDCIRRTLGGMFVGSVDTTAGSVAKIMAMIGRDPDLARFVASDVDDPNRLAGYCWEAMRRWPHNPILLRQAAIDTEIAGTAVKEGDEVILWTHAAMLDASVFPDPLHVNPGRPPGSYLHFGGGLHPCAGRAVNDFQIPLLVGALVRRGVKSVGDVRWAGPFPDHLAVDFAR